MKIHITFEAKRKLELYTEAVTGEISGLGLVEKRNGEFWIEDVYIFKQESTIGDTDLNPDAIAEFLNEMIVAGKDPAKLKLWWHSHGSMGAFWSGTDTATMGKFGNGWMLSLVVNKRGEYKCRLDIYDPIHIYLENVEMETHLPMASEELRKRIEAEVKEKVSTRTYGTTVVYGSSWRDDDRSRTSGVGFCPAQRSLPASTVGNGGNGAGTGTSGFPRRAGLPEMATKEEKEGQKGEEDKSVQVPAAGAQGVDEIDHPIGSGYWSWEPLGNGASQRVWHPYPEPDEGADESWLANQHLGG